MIVTDLKKSLLYKKKYDVYLDYECSFTLYESELKKLNIETGREITEEYYKESIIPYLKKNALNDSFRMIARCDYSRKEIIEKLSRRNYPYDVILYTADYLCEHKYIDDYEYSVKFVKHAFSAKNKGKAYVEMELFRKGIDKELISSLISEYYKEDDIYNIAEKKLKSILKGKETPDIKDLNKLRDYLLRQGFSYDEISDALSRMKGKYEY